MAENYDKWFGEIFNELRTHRQLLSEIKSDIKVGNDQVIKIDKRVISLEKWVISHEREHDYLENNISISKGSIILLFSALITSGMIGYLLKHLVGG